MRTSSPAVDSCRGGTLARCIDDARLALTLRVTILPRHATTASNVPTRPAELLLIGWSGGGLGQVGRLPRHSTPLGVLHWGWTELRGDLSRVLRSLHRGSIAARGLRSAPWLSLLASKTHWSAGCGDDVAYVNVCSFVYAAGG